MRHMPWHVQDGLANIVMALSGWFGADDSSRRFLHVYVANNIVNLVVEYVPSRVFYAAWPMYNAAYAQCGRCTVQPM